MVTLIVTYGSEIWGVEPIDVIEAVHIQYCREFFGVNESVNNSIVLAECGRKPLYAQSYPILVQNSYNAKQSLPKIVLYNVKVSQ